MTSGPPRPLGGGEISTCTEVLTPTPAEALAGLLDIDAPPLAAGAALPPLWHWVYLLSGAPTHRTNPQPAEPPAAPSAARQFDIDPVLLFRFSALTYNAHRIHYDRDYAVAEGYPDLVVHGPLQALLMGEPFRHNGLSMMGRQFSYRLVAPVFGPQRLTVAADITGTGASAKVYIAPPGSAALLQVPGPTSDLARPSSSGRAW